MSAVDEKILRAVDELQVRYIDALDRRDMDGWLAAFDEKDASYILQTAESEEARLPLALILDDNRARLEDRVSFITRVWAGTYQEYRTRHFIQRLDCRPAKAGLYAVRTNFMVAFTRLDLTRTELLATGVYHDLVAVEGGTARFRAKKALTDASALPHYVVYPL